MELHTFKLAPEHEPFTELYFQNYQDIPKVVVSGKTYSFLFVIHDLEGTDMSYPYTTYVQDQSGAKLQTGSGEVMVRDGAYAAIPVSYSLPAGSKSAEIFVDLYGKQQELHFTIVSAQ